MYPRSKNNQQDKIDKHVTEEKKYQQDVPAFPVGVDRNLIKTLIPAMKSMRISAVSRPSGQN